MKIGMVGLGRMGSNMARRLMRGGHQCVVFDLNPQSVSQLAKEGAQASTSLEDLAARLEKLRAVWIMLPAGEPTEQTVTTLAGRIEPGDISSTAGIPTIRTTCAKQVFWRPGLSTTSTPAPAAACGAPSAATAS